MRILLVASRVTYVKDNYDYLLKEISRAFGDEIAGLCVIDNIDFKMFFSALLIIAAGARKTGTIVIKNIFNALFFHKKEKLFKKCFYTKSINDSSAIEKIRELKPDLIINLRTRDIYREEILNVPEIGCINIHHGILPDNRGTMCDLWALYEGRKPGFSVHYMNKDIDAGNILKVKEINNENIKDYTELPFLSSKKEAVILIEIINKIKKYGKLTGVENKTNKIRFTKNPNLSQIRKIKDAGFIL